MEGKRKNYQIETNLKLVKMHVLPVLASPSWEGIIQMFPALLLEEGMLFLFSHKYTFLTDFLCRLEEFQRQNFNVPQIQPVLRCLF